MESEKTKLAKFRMLMGTFVKKWTVEVVYCLYQTKSVRFTDLRKMLSGVSSRTLSDRLRELEEMGLVRRTVYPEKPVRVLYELTAAGRRIGELAYESFDKLVDAWDEVVGRNGGKQ